MLRLVSKSPSKFLVKLLPLNPHLIDQRVSYDHFELRVDFYGISSAAPTDDTAGSADTGSSAASAAAVPAPSASGDYSHFNNKLTINDFDLLKV